MKIHIYILSILLIFTLGCSKESPVSPDKSADKGAIVLKIDRENAPESVVLVSAVLTRSGFQSISNQMNLMSDSTADLNLSDIPVGEWHLKVDAKNQAGVIEYTGETSVNILNNTVIEVTLTLYPVSGGTGGIHLFVTWGTESTIWKDSPHNPILKSSQNPTNPLFITTPRVIYDNGIYKMWYNCVRSGGTSDVWYAESSDGKSWNTIGIQPVLVKGSYENWDSYSVSAVVVFKEGNLYKMYYAGWNTHPYNVQWKIGLAISQDGKNWIKHPTPVITDHNQYYRLGLTSVVKYENLYYGYFGFHSYNYSKLFIGVATSIDGINWEMYGGNPILSATNVWEGTGTTSPCTVLEDGKFKMYYQNMAQTSIGYAESADGFNFTKENKPVFTSQQTLLNYDFVTYINYLNVNNQRRIYYTGQHNSASNLDGICFIYK